MEVIHIKNNGKYENNEIKSHKSDAIKDQNMKITEESEISIDVMKNIAERAAARRQIAHPVHSPQLPQMLHAKDPGNAS